MTPVIYRQAYDCLGEVGSHLSLLLAHSKVFVYNIVGLSFQSFVGVMSGYLDLLFSGPETLEIFFSVALV